MNIGSTINSSFSTTEVITMMGLDRLAQAKFSNLFIDQIKYGLNTRSFHAAEVIGAIKEIENNVCIKTEKQRPFQGNILKGFWYKHWFEARFIPQNLVNHWKLSSKRSNKLHDQVRSSLKACGIKVEEIPVEKAGAQASYDLAQGFFARLRAKKLTGERIVFKPFDGVNYYLTLSFHAENDKQVFERIKKSCYPQFPFLFSNEV